jgi:Protein of unknown function (DUF2924)
MKDSGPSHQSRRGRRFGGALRDLEQKVARISQLETAALQETWEAVFRSRPSPSIARGFMIRALAYRLQEKALGALKPSASRILDRAAEGQSSFEPRRAPTRRTAAGTVLIREWRGVTHRVTVLDSDVVYRGRRYKSLSEVARLITGAHWSGPMFFGLKRRTKETAHG